MMQFYVNGVRQLVYVDDYLPVDKETKQPMFGRSDDGALWVPLLEKAWAKLSGCYADIQGETPFFAAPHLYGTPADYIYHVDVKNVNDFWVKLANLEK